MNSVNISLKLEEFEGLYGVFTLSERLLHKIWLKGDFEHKNIKTAAGKSIRVINAGTWNLHEGPDFKNAVLEIDGKRMVGDVEIHFRDTDWHQHGHGNDTNFRNVILHVVLFRPLGPDIKRDNGDTLEVLSLFELLTRDLEEYAIEDAILSLENRNYIVFVERLLQMPLAERQQFLLSKARVRWEQKLQFMKQRLSRFGWSESLHQVCLEALGFKRNRTAMSKLALHFPLKKLQEENISAEALFDVFHEDWKLNGLRPANHPKRRLEQYLRIISQENWTAKVSEYFSVLTIEDLISFDCGAAFRKRNKLGEIRQLFRANCLGDAISGSRLDTVFTDIMLPSYVALSGVSLFSLWFYWYPGDFPEKFSDCLRQSQVTDRSRNPCCNGWNQAILQLLLEGESAFGA